mmetsp:Transcript_5993/g.11247  ORF Transcript_5993/g.11247 Transcript_5993/m.11247 type:complete len:93 (-) Transcript_5993:133-411(-)
MIRCGRAGRTGDALAVPSVLEAGQRALLRGPLSEAGSEEAALKTLPGLVAIDRLGLDSGKTTNPGRWISEPPAETNLLKFAVCLNKVTPPQR